MFTLGLKVVAADLWGTGGGFGAKRLGMPKLVTEGVAHVVPP
jgi:hypothetical protein